MRQASLFELLGPTEPRRPPTWDDVQKHRAHLEDRIVPCDRCGRFGFDEEGRCLNTPERFGYPVNQGDGTCLKHYIVWDEES